MRAIWNGVTIARSDETIVVEGNHYFPAESVDVTALKASRMKSRCPWKGLASCYHVQAGLPDVQRRMPRPAPLELDPDRTAAEMDRLDQGGADPAHRVCDQRAGVAVGLDRLARKRRQHLRRVMVRGRHVTAVPLPLARALRARPHGQRQIGGLPV